MKLPRWIFPENGSSLVRLSILSLLGLVLAGCANCHESTADRWGMWADVFHGWDRCHNSPPEDWAKEDLIGHRLTCKDPNRVQSFAFDNNHDVYATIGQQHNFADRTLCWKLRNGRLLIYDRHCVYEDLALLSVNGNHVQATRPDGHLLEFELK